MRLRLADPGGDARRLLASDPGRASAADRRPGACSARCADSHRSSTVRRRRSGSPDYLDAIAAGEDPLEALPKLGAFVDRAPAETVDANRIAANLRLGECARTDAVLSGSNLAAVRTRRERLFREKLNDEQRALDAVSTR